MESYPCEKTSFLLRPDVAANLLHMAQFQIPWICKIDEIAIINLKDQTRLFFANEFFHPLPSPSSVMRNGDIIHLPHEMGITKTQRQSMKMLLQMLESSYKIIFYCIRSDKVALWSPVGISI